MSEYIVDVSKMSDDLYDAVEGRITGRMVRCRDCKHYGIYNGSWCRRTYEPVPNGTYDYQTVEPDGFCAWSERRDGEDARGSGSRVWKQRLRS